MPLLSPEESTNVKKNLGPPVGVSSFDSTCVNAEEKLCNLSAACKNQCMTKTKFTAI